MGVCFESIFTADNCYYQAEMKLAEEKSASTRCFPACKVVVSYIEYYILTHTHSPYVHGLSSFSYSDSLFSMDAPFCIHTSSHSHQIPHATYSAASPYVHGLSSFSYSDSLFTMDAPFTPHPVHTRSHMPHIPQPLPTSTVSAHSLSRIWWCVHDEEGITKGE